MELNPLEVACQRVLERLQSGDLETELESALEGEPEIFRARIREDIAGIGPIKYLLDDEEITEIVINGRHSVWFEKKGTFHFHPDAFLSAITFENFRHRLCEESGIHSDLNIPCADG